MTTFDLSSIPHLGGRTVVVTGANSGIGRVTADVLASHGARVIVAVRDPDKGRAAAAAMSGQVEVRNLDLADLSSIRAFAAGLDEPVHTLVNNAGLMTPPLGRTKDGFELQFGTNHLGHFALTNLLLPRITGRVVTISSGAHIQARSLDFDDLNWRDKPYRPAAAYAQSKVANLLFTAELHRRLERVGSSVLSLAAHPGWAATNLTRHDQGQGLGSRVRQLMNRIVSQSVQDGALPTLFAVTEDLPGNAFVGPDGFMQARGNPTLTVRSKLAKDAGVARRLWEVSEQMTGVPFGLTAAPGPTGPDTSPGGRDASVTTES